MDEASINVLELYRRLAERFNLPEEDIESWPDALSISIEVYSEAQRAQIYRRGRVYATADVFWMQLFWENVFDTFPPDFHPDYFTLGAGADYVLDLITEHFEQVCLIFRFAHYVAEKLFDKLNGAMDELLDEAALVARFEFKYLLPEDEHAPDATDVKMIRKEETEALSRRLGMRPRGKPAKVAEAERDALVLATLLDSKNDATVFSQKRVANVLGVTPRTLTTWAGLFGWEAYCGALLDKAQIDGVSPERVAEKLAQLDRQRGASASESETRK